MGGRGSVRAGLGHYGWGLLAMAVLSAAASPVTGQAWRPSDLEISTTVDLHQVEADDWDWDGVVSLRRTIRTRAFLTLEVARASDPLSFCVLTFFPRCGSVNLRYLSTGGGVQVPLGPLRPHVGITVGVVSREGGGAALSSSELLGLSYRLSRKLLLLAEYRLRQDRLERERFDGPRDQWLIGIGLTLK